MYAKGVSNYFLVKREEKTDFEAERSARPIAEPLFLTSFKLPFNPIVVFVLLSNLLANDSFFFAPPCNPEPALSIG
jgi:hypothetical protein